MKKVNKIIAGFLVSMSLLVGCSSNQDAESVMAIYTDEYTTFRYKIIDAKEYGIHIDESQYVFGVNIEDDTDLVTLDKADLAVGDLVDVTFENDNLVDGIVDVKEVK